MKDLKEALVVLAIQMQMNLRKVVIEGKVADNTEAQCLSVTYSYIEDG